MEKMEGVVATTQMIFPSAGRAVPPSLARAVLRRYLSTSHRRYLRGVCRAWKEMMEMINNKEMEEGEARGNPPLRKIVLFSEQYFESGGRHWQMEMRHLPNCCGGSRRWERR